MLPNLHMGHKLYTKKTVAIIITQTLQRQTRATIHFHYTVKEWIHLTKLKPHHISLKLQILHISRIKPVKPLLRPDKKSGKQELLIVSKSYQKRWHHRSCLAPDLFSTDPFESGCVPQANHNTVWNKATLRDLLLNLITERRISSNPKQLFTNCMSHAGHENQLRLAKTDDMWWQHKIYFRATSSLNHMNTTTVFPRQTPCLHPNPLRLSGMINSEALWSACKDDS